MTDEIEDRLRRHLTASADRVHQLADAHAAQAVVSQPGHLPRELGRSHAQFVRVLGNDFDAVVHQDQRHLPQAEPAEVQIADDPVLTVSHQRLAAATGRNALRDPAASRRATVVAAWREPYTKRETGPRLAAAADPTKYKPGMDD